MRWRRRSGGRWPGGRWSARAALRGGEAVVQAVAAEISSLPGAVAHDVVAGLAERVTDLAAGERAAWARFVKRAAGLRLALLGRDHELLRFDRARELETADALVAACARGGQPRSAPELETLRAAHREARADLLAQAREREATIAVIDQALYRLYGVEGAEATTIEGRTPAASGSHSASARPAPAAPDGVAAGRRSRRRGARDSLFPEEARGEMRTVSKGGHPGMVARCLEHALAEPYSRPDDFNRAMDYVPTSATGSHYLNTAILTGLLTETRPGWFRPTTAGRALAAAEAESDAGVWDALLALPAYRRYLEYKILTIIARNRNRSETEARQTEAMAFGAFPAFRARADSIRDLLGLGAMAPSSAVSALRNPPALEPIGWDAVHAWMGAQGLGHARSDLSRAGEIARVLARASQIPLTVRGEWLESAELLALLLLIAARQHGRGVIVASAGASAGASRGGDSPLARAVERLRRYGVDIRVERRGERLVAALVPAVALLLEPDALAKLRKVGAPELAPVVGAVSEAVAAPPRPGLDGVERGTVPLEELAARLIEAALEGVGEFASAAAADEAEPVASTITIGPPLPLASDLRLLGHNYRFLDDAVDNQRRGVAGGVAALLSEWGVAQRRGYAEELARSPHLALLYLIVTDGGVEPPERSGAGWFIGGTPLASALDDRLRGLGYEVWDEGYRADEKRQFALSAGLVEQALSLGILTPGHGAGHALDAPNSKDYYPARDLLAIKPATRSAR